MQQPTRIRHAARDRGGDEPAAFGIVIRPPRPDGPIVAQRCITTLRSPGGVPSGGFRRPARLA
jgi:hypothetical protein